MGGGGVGDGGGGSILTPNPLNHLQKTAPSRAASSNMFVFILALACVYRGCNEDIVFDAAASNTHGMPRSPSPTPEPRLPRTVSTHVTHRELDFRGRPPLAHVRGRETIRRSAAAQAPPPHSNIIYYTHYMNYILYIHHILYICNI